MGFRRMVDDPIRYEELIACLKRELALRRRVYPVWISKGRMKQEKADHEIACMSRILELFEACFVPDDETKR